ncbi:MAG: O-antigen ligase family protein [Thermoleophilaceae bacterium]|nr:O-antigen ligase family protein [Thermoleophilaceae bacterium]
MSSAVLSGGWGSVAAFGLTLLVAGWLWGDSNWARACWGVAVLAITPLVLLLSVTGDNEASLPHVRLALIAGALIVGLAGLVATTAVFVRWPRLIAPAALLALPFRVPLAVGGQSVKLLLPLYLVIAAAVLALFWQAVVHSQPQSSEPRGRRRLDLVLAVVVVLYGLQSIYSADANVAIQNIAFFYAPFALLYGVVSRIAWDRRLVNVCLASAIGLALVLVGVGFIEYARGEYLVRPGGIQANDFDPYFRIQSLFFDPNIFGRFLVVVMLLTTAAMLQAREALRAGAFGAVIAVLWAGLVLTLSQSSFLALLAGLIAIAALQWRTRLVLATVAGLAALAVIATVAFPSAVGIDLSSTRALQKTTSGRFDLVTGGVDLWVKKPVFGYGSGSFSREFSDQNFAANEGNGESTTSKSHTAPLTVAAEQGLLGLIGFGLFSWFGFSTVMQGAARRNRPGVGARIGVAAAFTAVFVHSLSYAALLEDPLTWTLLGSAVGLAGMRRESPESKKPTVVMPAEASA